MNNWRFETKQLHSGQVTEAVGACAVPLYQTAAYVFPSAQSAEDRFALREEGNIYGRLTNPTQAAFEARVAALEGGRAALAVASGAAAVTYAIQNIAAAGDHIVASKTIYGGTYALLAHTLADFGITTTFFDPFEAGSLAGAIQDNTKAVFVESLGNPNSNPIDLAAVADAAHSRGIPLIVDNTFATPYLLRPIEYGADIVIHSATKFLGGHGTAIGGILVEGGSFDWAAGGKFPALSAPCPNYHGAVFTDVAPTAPFVTRIRTVLLRDMGAAIAPLHAFLFLQGLETLSLRVERHVSNALHIVDFLSKHPRVTAVNHPSLASAPGHALYQRYFPHGGGSIFTFVVDGGAEAAKRVIDRLQIFSIVANVADAKSLVIHPASTTHSQLSPNEMEKQGIFPGSIRLSVGLEHIDDLLADLQQALDA